MERERNKADPDGLAEVWRSAEQRRAEDIGEWFSRFFQPRRLKTSDAQAQYPRGNPVPG